MHVCNNYHHTTSLPTDPRVPVDMVKAVPDIPTSVAKKNRIGKEENNLAWTRK